MLFVADFNPIALEIGPLIIRWYSLAYLVGFLGGWGIGRYLAKLWGGVPSAKQVDDFLMWIVIGVIAGGRLGYVLFYNLPYYWDHPLQALQLWHGGMSFHGGLLGVVVAVAAFSYKYGIHPLKLGDMSSIGATIGLFFGRLANFINGELYGRPVDGGRWGVIFPHSGDSLPRHPSQLYEAVCEGLALFIVTMIMVHRPWIRQRPGIIFGVLLLGYGAARFVIEFVRVPDAQLGRLALGLSMGQWLCIPMIFVGIGLIAWRLSKGKVDDTP